MESPLYQGSQFSPAHALQGSVSPQHPFAQNFLQSAAALTNQALDFEAAIRDRQEYTLEQNRSAALQAAQQALDTEMIERLSLADGAEDSFYNENGLLKKDELQSIRSRYLSIADAWTSGFTTEQGRAAATQAQQQYRSSVTNSINSKILAGLGNRARRALQTNIQAHMARGDFDTPIKLVQQSKADGYTSDADAILLKNDINTARYENEINAASDPDALAAVKNQLESSPFFKSPNGKSLANKMLRKIDSLLTYQAKAAAVEEESIISTTAPSQKEQQNTSSPSSAKGSKSLKITPAQAPPASDGWIHRHFFLHGSNLKDPAAQKAALSLLFKEASIHITDPSDLTSAFDVELLGKSLELPQDTINNVIKQRQQQLTAQLPGFDVDNAVKAIYKRFDSSVALRNHANSEYQESEPELAQEWNKVFQYHDIRTKSIVETARQDFHSWQASHPNANAVEQARTFQQLLTSRMKEDETISAAPHHSWAHLHLNEFFSRYSSAESNAAKSASLDSYSQKALKQQLQADTAQFIKILKAPSLVQDYYRGDYKGAISRFIVNNALAHQAKSVRIDSPMDNPAKAAALPNTNSQLIIYTNPDPEKTSSISRQKILLVQQGGDTFTVKIVETNAVSAPVPSVLLQQKLKLIGRKPNHFYFQNNILTFTQKKKTKSPLYKNSTTSAYTDDGLVPLDEYAAVEQEGIFPGTTISAEYDMPTSALPL